MSPGLPLLLVLALGAETRIESGVRLQAEARRLDPHPASADATSLDLSALPHATMQVRDGRASATAAYTPRFSLTDVGPDAQTEAMHQGTLRLRLEEGERFELEAFGSASAGRTDLLTERRSAGASGGIDPTGAGTAGGQGADAATSTVLTTQRIDLEALRAGVSLRVSLDPRTDVLLAGAVSQEGGTNASSRAAVPVVRGADAQAELRRRATPLDRLGLRLTGAAARIASRRADSAQASALATWRRRLSPDSELWTGAGAVVFQSRLPEAEAPSRRSTERRLRPAAELGLTRSGGAASPDRLPTPTGELAAILGAALDRATGETSPSVNARASLRWPLDRAVDLVATGSGGVRWSDEERTRQGRLELGASFRLAPRASLDVTGYGDWQRSDDRRVPEVNVYGAIVSLGLEAPPLGF